jgi:hypothetical protein
MSRLGGSAALAVLSFDVHEQDVLGLTADRYAIEIARVRDDPQATKRTLRHVEVDAASHPVL